MFTFRLAGHLRMIRSEMLARMGARELQAWIAFDRINPISDGWQQTGLLAALLYNAHATSGPRKTAEDFIPSVKVRRVQTDREQQMAMRAIAAGMQGFGQRG